MKISISLLVVMLFVNRAAFAEDNFVHWHGVQRISYETMTLPRDERMGLAGFQYLVDVSPRLYAGLGLFGAVAGERGGFFTGGFETGLRQPIAGALSLDAGLFLGGGGGGNSPQGGGLMVRPHLGLLYDVEDVRLAIAYALVDFPNGDIRSSHAVFFLDIPFDALRMAPDHPGDPAALLDRASHAANQSIIFNREHLVARYTVYSPPDRIMDLNGKAKTGTIQVTGIEYSRDFNKSTYLFIEASGASGGQSDGYAEVFFGGGYRMPIYERRLFLDSRISAGVAGGGDVDTGGGGAGKASIGLKFVLGDDLSIDTRAGFVVSAGEFHAKTVEFGLSYALETAAFGRSNTPHRHSADELQIDSWRTRFSFQLYTSRLSSMRKGGEDNTISLLGVKIDKFVGTGAFYLTGQAQSAFAGGAGGYSAGLMGIGYLSGPIARTGVHVYAEAVGGAAGGGGMDVGGGAVIQPLVGVLYDISSSAGVEASIGRIKALHGGLDSTVASVSFVYRFSTLGRRVDSR